jgi:hypothetical protein
MTEVVGWAATVYKDPCPSFPLSNLDLLPPHSSHVHTKWLIFPYLVTPPSSQLYKWVCQTKSKVVLGSALGKEMENEGAGQQPLPVLQSCDMKQPTLAIQEEKYI